MRDALATTHTIFNDRMQDIEIYFSILENESVPRSRNETAILRATTTLLFYNMIEATIKNLFFDFYVALGRRPFEQLSVELQTLYIDLRLTENDPFTAKHDTYIKKSEDVIKSILYPGGVSMPVSRQDKNGFKKVNKGGGNLDISTIQNLFNRHGIDTTDIRFPGCMSTIKNERNALSHGSKTFVEVGSHKELEGPEGLKKEKMDIKKVLEELIEKVSHVLQELENQTIAI